MDGLHGDAQGLPAASPPYGQPQHLAGGMANGAQAQLEALLAASSQSQQSGHLGGMQHDYGGAAWGGGIGHGRAGISPAPQASSASVHSLMAGLGGSMRGGSGTGTPNSSIPGVGSVGSIPNGGLSQHSGSTPLLGSTGGITPASIGPGGVCMDFLSGRCTRGAACSLSHTLPQMSSQLPQASAQMQQPLQQQPLPQQPQSYLQHHQQLQQQQQQLHQQQQQQQMASQQQQMANQQQQQQQQPQQHGAADNGMMLLRGLEMTRAAAEITRQELSAVVLGQARLLQEQASGLAALEKQVADLQRYFTSALLTFEQRHWAALLGNEQRITNKVEQTIAGVVSAIEGKLDSMRQVQEEDGLIRQALSSNASTAQWPQARLKNYAPLNGGGNAGAPTSDDTMQPRGLPAALGRLNMGSGEVRLPPTSDAPKSPNSNRTKPSPEQEEVEALLREISASSAGGSGNLGSSSANGVGEFGELKGGKGRAGSGDDGSGKPPAGVAAARKANDSPWRQSPPSPVQQQPGGTLPNRLRGGSSQAGSGPAAAGDDDGVGRPAAGAGRGGGGGHGSGGGGHGGDDDDQRSVVSSNADGRRSSSGRQIPEEVVREVKDIQDEETGELLRVFEEHQNSSSASDGSVGGSRDGGGGSSQGGRVVGQADGCAQRAASGVSSASSGSDATSGATSGDVRRRLQAAQQLEAGRSGGGGGASSS